MPRSRRSWTHQDYGCYHIISRVADSKVWFSDEEKEYFLKLLEKYSSGFYVDIHAFCVMGNHFHILATGLEEDAKVATEEELIERYRKIFGTAEIPCGKYEADGTVVPDDDFGTERLRNRLGSISRFVQELKQTFTRWYNKRHNRRGYLWGDRFKGVLVSKGEAEAVASAYIDLNPIRAKIKNIKVPEDYRWSSMGLRVRSPKRYKALVTDISYEPCVENGYSWYRQFVYESGGIKKEGKRSLSQDAINDIKKRCGKLGIVNKLRYRCLNISEGLAIGNSKFIEDIQKRSNRKYIRPRKFIHPDNEKGKQLKNYATGLCTTRVIRQANC